MLVLSYFRMQEKEMRKIAEQKRRDREEEKIAK